MAIMKTYKMGDLPEDNMGYGKDAKSPKQSMINVVSKGPLPKDNNLNDESFPKGKSKSGVDAKVFKLADEKDY